MNNYELTFLVVALAASDVRATDRVVSSSGTFPSINAAIAVSAEGDRILVEPGLYDESITISKGLSILPNQQSGRFTLNGSVLLDDVNGRTILLSGMRIVEGLSMSGNNTTLTKLLMVDCYSASIDIVDPFTQVELYRDTIATRVRISSGSVVGSTVLGGTFNGNGMVEISGTSELPNEVFIIGNKIGSPMAQPETFGIYINTTGVWHIENNFVEVRDVGNAIVLAIPGHPYTAPSTIDNNTLYTTSGPTPGPNGFTTAVNVIGSSSFNLSTANNCYVGFPDGWIVTTMGWAELRQTSNFSSGVGQVDPDTGRPLVGSSLVDLGDPDARYLDLDLTRNDVGCYGGSNSRANFTTPMGSAVVGFMQAPRVISQGDPVDIRVIGFDR